MWRNCLAIPAYRCVPDRAIGFFAGLATGYADVAKGCIVEGLKGLALPPDGMQAGQRVDGGRSGAAGGRMLRSWSLSFHRFVMFFVVSINFLDVYGGMWFILKTNVFEFLHQGS